jgi:hypothetical protein
VIDASSAVIAILVPCAAAIARMNSGTVVAAAGAMIGASGSIASSSCSIRTEDVMLLQC